MIDFRMNTFRVLYHEMNYRKTADRLNMTQPGVTQHIQYLEKYYGVKLFEYSGKALVRTRECELLKKYADAVWAEEQEVRRAFQNPGSLLLKVGATKTIGEFVLSDMVNRFLSDESHSLNLVIDNTENLLYMLENSELDFAIVEGVFDKKRYSYRLFKKESFVGICSARHRFAGKQVPLEELFKESLVIRERGSGTRALLEQAVADRGFSLECFKRTVSAGNFRIITDLVIGQNAITFAYAPIAESRENLSVFETEDMKISGEFNFVYCSEKAAGEKIRLFMGKDCHEGKNFVGR